MEQRHALSFTFTSPQIRMEKGREQESESRSQGKGCVASVSPNLISNGSSQYTDGVPIHSFFDAEKAKERQTENEQECCKQGQWNRLDHAWREMAEYLCQAKPKKKQKH